MSNTTALSPRVRRLCLSVDLKGYHKLDPRGQERAQHGLGVVLDQAAEATDARRVDWSRQEAGDGELALLHPDIDEINFIQAFIPALHASLHSWNLGNQPRLRLRLAIHQGLTRAGASGWAGDAVVTVSRLCDAEAGKRVLEKIEDVDLVVLISAPLFSDVIGDEPVHLRRQLFVKTRIDIPAKDFTADAWVFAPGLEASSVRRVLEAAPPEQGSGKPESKPPSSPSGTGGTWVGGNVGIGGRDGAGGNIIHHAPEGGSQ